uniref:Charged multivesicular body protein 2a (Chromatin-modifying protein 2a) n=1 Tax=Schistosoma japonicum TaxID=6182 RepID=C1LMV0_SCHJA|nr:Charged multivesicular body protein 2a (Chromatin-modifying protein 2a) [Schistosoma japonicum]
MSFLFGKRKTPEEQLRDSKRVIVRAIRETEREKKQLEQDCNRIGNEMRMLAKLGQIDAVKVLAMQLVRTRNYIKKFNAIHTNLTTLSMKMQTQKSTAIMAGTMKKVALTLREMNSSMNLPQLQRVMMELDRQTEIMDMKEEMISDAIDSTIGEPDDLEDSEAVVEKLNVIGSQLSPQCDMRYHPTKLSLFTPIQFCQGILQSRSETLPV